MLSTQVYAVIVDFRKGFVPGRRIIKGMMLRRSESMLQELTSA